MWERFAEVVKSDDDELERNAEGANEITQKENETAKEGRVIQTFKAEHEKLKEKRGGGQWSWEELEKALNEDREACRGTEVYHDTE